MRRVEGKVALITGGALGIGEAIATVMAREGAKVVIADCNEAAGKKTASTLQASGAETIFVKLDVSSESEWTEAIKQVVKRFGRVDILVNNAGIYIATDAAGAAISGATENTSLDVWERTFAVNARGVFLGSKAVIPVMRKGGGGSITNISSNWGLIGVPDGAAYVASKGAVRLLTKATAADVAKDNIRVNSVHPGPTDSVMMHEILKDPVLTKKYLGPSLLGRAARTEEIANAVLFVASDEASYMTGSELVVDGGYTAV
jgi:cyclopentanol dehydrogenase